MVIDKKKILKAVVPAIAGATVGVGVLAVYERVKTGWWPWEKEPEPEDEVEDLDDDEAPSYPLVEYRNGDEETLGDSELAHKPNIFLFETQTPVMTTRVISQEEFMDLAPESQHVATWFIDDEIFAGLDDMLDELDPMEVCGGIGEDALLTLKSGTVSGLYVMCGDGETGLEIIVSHGNYLEEYEAIQEILAADIADSEGYSQQGADEVVISRTSRRR
jgi:hypothetical protein